MRWNVKRSLVSIWSIFVIQMVICSGKILRFYSVEVGDSEIGGRE